MDPTLRKSRHSSRPAGKFYKLHIIGPVSRFIRHLRAGRIVRSIREIGDESILDGGVWGESVRFSVSRWCTKVSKTLSNGCIMVWAHHVARRGETCCIWRYIGNAE